LTVTTVVVLSDFVTSLFIAVMRRLRVVIVAVAVREVISLFVQVARYGYRSLKLA